MPRRLPFTRPARHPGATALVGPAGRPPGIMFTGPNAEAGFCRPTAITGSMHRKSIGWIAADGVGSNPRREKAVTARDKDELARFIMRGL